jgi:predicted MFS family arabinose efflux permease
VTDLLAGPAAAPRLFTSSMVRLLAVSFGSLASLYLLLPVVPLYVATSGAGDVGAGSATGVMMLSTVLAELAVPRLLARHGYRAALVLGPLLLGGGAAATAASPGLGLVLAACAARGAGLAVVVVAGPVLAAELAPPERQGEALGLYGVAVGLPAVACLPLGLWLSLRFGYAPAMLAGAVPALLALAAVPGLPARRGERTGPRTGVLRGLADGGLARPAVVFAALTVAAGVLLTFLPLAVPARSRGIAAVALLVHACTMPLARWAAGRYGDRRGPAGLLVPSVLVAAIGMAGLVWLREPYAVMAGAALFGAGFGAAQNVTLALMFRRAPRSGLGRVSALWNLAYDGGMGVGAAGFGLVAGPAGYPGGFALTAALLFAALVPAWFDGRSR